MYRRYDRYCCSGTQFVTCEGEIGNSGYSCLALLAGNPMKIRVTPSSKLISFHPAPEADPQVGHRANTVHFARYFFRLPFPILFRLHLRSLLVTSPERVRVLVKIVQLSSTPLASSLPKTLLRSFPCC